MGLVEKRITAALQKENFAAWKKMVVDACGLQKLQFEIAWEELVKEGFADYYPKNVEYNFFAPLSEALESICSDDLGKEAFAEKIKKVHIGSKRGWSGLQAKVENDTLYLDADPSYAKTKDDCRDYAKYVRETIENAL
jgi:hypothetical protein